MTDKTAADNRILLQLARAVWLASNPRGALADNDTRRMSWEANRKNAMMLARRIHRQLDKHDIVLVQRDGDTPEA